MILESESFGRECGAIVNAISTLIKEVQERFLTLSCM